MRQFTILELITPGFAAITVISILLINLYYYIRLKSKDVSGFLSLLSVAALYLIFETFFVISGPYSKNLTLALQACRLQELSIVLFFIAIPYFIDHVILLEGKIKTLNTVVFRIGIAISIVFLSISIFLPDLFVSVSKPVSPLLQEINWGRGRTGLFFFIRDLLLIILMLYSLIILMVYWENKSNILVNKFVISGFAATVLFALFELYHTFTDEYLLLPNLYIQRFEIGIVVFSVSIFMGIFQHFISSLKDTILLTRELEEQENKLRYQANYDRQTEVFNRRLFFENMENILNNVGNTGVLMLDVEGFHDLNEAFGKEIGDSILVEVAKRLKSNAREADSVFRIGSDEFSIILPDLPSRDLLIRYVEVLHTSLTNPYKINNQMYFAGSSIGAIYLPEDAENVQDAMKHLFTSLRSAKIKRNSVEFFNQELRNQQERKARIAHQIRQSLKTEEFYVQYQPIVDSDKNIIAVEALIRWKEEYFPDEFIPLAESAGLMHELGNVIFNKTILDIIRFKEQLNVPVHINLSPAQFTDDDFALSIIARLQASGLNHKHVSFEITESFMIDNLESTIRNLQVLKDHKFSVSLDDFGTGYSSLNYLHKLPIDILKIDKSFIDNLGPSLSKDSLIHSIINIAGIFNFKIIAEGIETQQQFDVLKKLGVKYFQGYHFHRSMDLDKLLELCHGHSK